MQLKSLLMLATALCGASSHADNCEPIAQQIEARMRAGGLPTPRLIVVDKGTATTGRVLGSCASGNKQILQVAGPAAPDRPSPATDNIPTECKDGRVVRGPDCSKPAVAAASR